MCSPQKKVKLAFYCTNKVGLSYQGKSRDWGCAQLGCWWWYLGPRGRK